MAGRQHSSGLRRDLELLQVLAGPEAQHGGLGVVRIAALAGREKTQVSRALATLAQAGLVERDDRTLGYRLGWRLYTLATQTFESYLVELSRPFLRQLVDRVKETAHLCVLRGDEVLTLATEAAPAAHGFRVSWDGVTVSAPATSSGRVLLSGWDDVAIRRRFTPQRLRAAGGNRVFADVEELVAEVGRVRARGYAVVDEDFDLGVVGCSAPVRDGHGRIVAALNVGAPKARLGGREAGRAGRLDAAGRVTATVAAELSAALVRSAG